MTSSFEALTIGSKARLEDQQLGQRPWILIFERALPRQQLGGQTQKKCDSCGAGLSGGVPGRSDHEGLAWAGLLCSMTLEAAGIIDLRIFDSITGPKGSWRSTLQRLTSVRYYCRCFRLNHQSHPRQSHRY